MSQWIAWAPAGSSALHCIDSLKQSVYFPPTPSASDIHVCECARISPSAAREGEQVAAYAVAVSKPYARAGCSAEPDRLENRAQSCRLPPARGNDLGFVSSAQQRIFSELGGRYLLSILCQMKLKFLNEFKIVGEIRLGGGREKNRSIVQSFK